MDKKFCCNCDTNKCGLSLTVREASDDLIESADYYLTIWSVISKLGNNRRDVEEKIIEVFCWACCTTFQDSEGVEIILPEFEDVFPPDDSLSCRWTGRFIERDCKNANLPKRFYNAKRYKGQYIPLLRVLDLAAKLIDPEPFRKINQIC